MNKKTALYVAAAGLAINLIDAYTSTTNGVIDPNKGYFYGTTGVFKTTKNAGMYLMLAGGALYLFNR